LITIGQRPPHKRSRNATYFSLLTAEKVNNVFSDILWHEFGIISWLADSTAVQTEAMTEKMKGISAVSLSQGHPFSVLGNFDVR